jgi:hypothetical protein
MYSGSIVILKIKEARRQILLRIQEYQQQMQAIVEIAEKEVEKEE